MENVILLADKNSPSWDFANKMQKYILKEKEDFIPLKEVRFKKFGNKEIKPKVKDNVRKKEIYFIHDSNKNPQEWWIDVLLLKDLLLSASAENVTFIFPDMPYQRQDRKDEPHVPISARAMAQTISPELKRIITMDLHSSQIQGFYPANVPFDTLESFPTVVPYLKNKPPIENLEELVIVSPDAGGTKRAGKLANKLGSIYPVAFIDKKREPITDKVIEMRLSGDVQDRNCLVVDDMYSSGSTSIESADTLIKYGARRLFSYATHGLFTNTELTNVLFDKFERVMVSNTHYTRNKKLEVIDVSPVFAEATWRAQKGFSISELFE